MADVSTAHEAKMEPLKNFDSPVHDIGVQEGMGGHSSILKVSLKDANKFVSGNFGDLTIGAPRPLAGEQ